MSDAGKQANTPGSLLFLMHGLSEKYYITRVIIYSVLYKYDYICIYIERLAHSTSTAAKAKAEDDFFID